MEPQKRPGLLAVAAACGAVSALLCDDVSALPSEIILESQETLGIPVYSYEKEEKTSACHVLLDDAGARIIALVERTAENELSLCFSKGIALSGIRPALSLDDLNLLYSQLKSVFEKYQKPLNKIKNALEPDAFPGIQITLQAEEILQDISLEEGAYQ